MPSTTLANFPVDLMNRLLSMHRTNVQTEIKTDGGTDKLNLPIYLISII